MGFKFLRRARAAIKKKIPFVKMIVMPHPDLPRSWYEQQRESCCSSRHCTPANTQGWWNENHGPTYHYPRTDSFIRQGTSWRHDSEPDHEHDREAANWIIERCVEEACHFRTEPDSVAPIARLRSPRLPVELHDWKYKYAPNLLDKSTGLEDAQQPPCSCASCQANTEDYTHDSHSDAEDSDLSQEQPLGSHLDHSECDTFVDEDLEQLPTAVEASSDMQRTNRSEAKARKSEGRHRSQSFSKQRRHTPYRVSSGYRRTFRSRGGRGAESFFRVPASAMSHSTRTDKKLDSDRSRGW
ncbi:uncharacterized protein LAESUDRAFT_728144 [Laetiporus sulphureus 93-53]|uniref:Uncharacterized protein n=1 Tax=Laetiporus sulphureus 93-53 TaxID=1314785 RepID=A0A165D8E1_9APHY|nr:uncharacterized protein LAESUDRAFT_728144 [Laetiporus sulphureus 93-53]KZT04324.1 hypothetical protein LAESUDRAFT_728144 [Laetiporus sulphureus 93-53]